jgi:hypothetical protein
MSVRLSLVSAGVLLFAAACTSETTATRTVEPPATAERAAAETANEVDQAVSPDQPFTEDELSTGVRATAVKGPATTFSTATVETTGGSAVGEVRSVKVGGDGMAVAINVEVGGFLNVGERMVSIDASEFTYLPERNILVTKLSKAEIEKMPAVDL